MSSVATFSDAKDTLRSKTAAQVIAETRATLLSLGISDESVSRLVENRNYTPADLLIMARALKRLNAGEHHCIHRARGRGGIAQRSILPSSTRADPCRAQRRTGRPCFIRHVWRATDQNVARNGNVVAASTVDDIAWTEVQQRTFIAATSEIHRTKFQVLFPVLATTGAVTPMAAAEVGKRGWKIVRIKP